VAQHELTLIALGGNAILPDNRAGTIQEQRSLTRATMRQVADCIASGQRVVLTHGNGPIVGNIALRNEAMQATIPPMPLDVCGADSQGGIGYMVQQILGNELRSRGLRQPVVSLITQIEVSPTDIAFDHPSKPIGPYYSSEAAQELRDSKQWTLVDDAGRGMRRVVPSPRPRRIIEIEVIRALVAQGVIVNCVGGGGVPVIDQANTLCGIEAVVDKDHSAVLLGSELGVTRLVLLTGVETVMQHFGRPNQRPLHQVESMELQDLLQAGEFPAGSMQPKIAAALDFLAAGGREVIITDPEHLAAALEGHTGTRVLAS
jgi:carbamate kinase